MNKEELLAFVLQASVEEVQAVLVEANAHLKAINATGVGFGPIPLGTPIGEMPDMSAILPWLRGVRQPKGPAEFKDKTVRNRLVFEIEKLGEFAKTLQQRLNETLQNYYMEDSPEIQD